MTLISENWDRILSGLSILAVPLTFLVFLGVFNSTLRFFRGEYYRDLYNASAEGLEVVPLKEKPESLQAKNTSKKKINASCPGCNFNLVGAVGASVTCPYCRSVAVVERTKELGEKS